MATTRSREDWLRAARLALLHHGVDGVQIAPLARGLGITRGSFYWHFESRGELLEALLREWEQEAEILIRALKSPDPAQGLAALFEELARRTRSSERGETPSDAAIFAWAALDPKVAKRANRAERERMRLFRKLIGTSALADLFYYAYHGFLLRRRRVPEAAGGFDALAGLALRALSRRGRPRLRGTRLALLAIGLAAMSQVQGCTTLRIVRYRDPDAAEPRKIFAQRIVPRAESPAPFVEAAPPRSDLDTVTVRDVGLEMRPLSDYLTRRHVRAFLVVRNDTILYERYSEGYGPATQSSSFSVAKAVTSALLGRALQGGKIRSLDDSVTSYLPELVHNNAYAGVTLRDLLRMESGIAYTRTNGHMWHDLRSGDAASFYTTHREHWLSERKREDPPGLRWAYKDGDAQLLGWVLTRATGRTIAQQLEEIWRPLGTEHDASWDLDRRDGLENTAAGLNATARDLARFGCLYRDGGMRNGEQIIPRDWVEASTGLDRSRPEPEVVTWWRMQHQHYWWIPMQDWEAERDFFADGSRGQRIYVHPLSHIVIVQLANESAQEFPFRKIVHYLMGMPFKYPRSIAGQLLSAAQGGADADSVRRLYQGLTNRAREHPADFVLNEAGMIGVGNTLLAKPGREPIAVAVLELEVERSPGSYRAHEALAAAYEKVGAGQRAAAEYREAARLAPWLAKKAAFGGRK